VHAGLVPFLKRIFDRYLPVSCVYSIRQNLTFLPPFNLLQASPVFSDAFSAPFITPFGCLVFGWAFAVMFARVALGRHYPTDTAAGAIIGIAVIFPISVMMAGVLLGPMPMGTQAAHQ
jgi:membrane-associated phospholipid phosphatase